MSRVYRSPITLGIETSCDETAVAVLRGRKVLGENIASSAKDQAPFGGIVPEIASRCHVEAILPCIDRALKQSKVRLKDIGLIAVTSGPGLMGSLLVGVAAAKSLGLALGVPVVPVDHVLAHAFSGQLMRKRTTYPFIGLVVSGGHTLLTLWKDCDKVAIIGRTFDDAAGEAFDKVAKMMDLGYPGGPVIDRISRTVDPAAYKFPRAWINEKHYNFSFSGLKTAVLYTIRDIRAERELDDREKSRIASAFQEAVCDVLTAKALRACKAHRIRTLVVGGGVAANSRLRETLPQEASERGMKLKILFPTLGLAADNAVMIAALGQAIVAKRKPRAGADFEPYSDFFVPKRRIVYNRGTSK